MVAAIVTDKVRMQHARGGKAARSSDQGVTRIRGGRCGRRGRCKGDTGQQTETHAPGLIPAQSHSRKAAQHADGFRFSFESLKKQKL